MIIRPHLKVAIFLDLQALLRDDPSLTKSMQKTDRDGGRFFYKVGPGAIPRLPTLELLNPKLYFHNLLGYTAFSTTLRLMPFNRLWSYRERPRYSANPLRSALAK